jgi:DegV family protein with EDD domain
MFKIALVTDTASDVSAEQAEKHHIKVLHYQIVYKENTYKDQLEITSKEVLCHLDEEVPTTSLPALDEMHALFEEIKNEGCTHVLAIPLSSGLSGCYNALNMVKDDYKELTTYIYDSKTISIAQGVLVLKAAELIQKGYTVESIVQELDKMRAKQHTLFIVDTLKYLVLGGRIGHVSAAIGTLLNIKPIITIGDDGKYHTFAKVRGRTKAITTFIKQTEEIISLNLNYRIYFTDGLGKETKEEIKKQVMGLNSTQRIEDWGWISPVACVHCGPGFVGMLIQEE